MRHVDPFGSLPIPCYLLLLLPLLFPLLLLLLLLLLYWVYPMQLAPAAKLLFALLFWLTASRNSAVATVVSYLTTFLPLSLFCCVFVCLN